MLVREALERSANILPVFSAKGRRLDAFELNEDPDLIEMSSDDKGRGSIPEISPELLLIVVLSKATRPGISAGASGTGATWLRGCLGQGIEGRKHILANAIDC